MEYTSKMKKLNNLYKDLAQKNTFVSVARKWLIEKAYNVMKSQEKRQTKEPKELREMAQQQADNLITEVYNPLMSRIDQDTKEHRKEYKEWLIKTTLQNRGIDANEYNTILASIEHGRNLSLAEIGALSVKSDIERENKNHERDLYNEEIKRYFEFNEEDSTYFDIHNLFNTLFDSSFNDMEAAIEQLIQTQQAKLKKDLPLEQKLHYTFNRVGNLVLGNFGANVLYASTGAGLKDAADKLKNSKAIQKLRNAKKLANQNLNRRLDTAFQNEGKEPVA